MSYSYSFSSSNLKLSNILEYYSDWNPVLQPDNVKPAGWGWGGGLEAGYGVGFWLSLLALGWGIWLIYSCSSWGGYISILLRPTNTGISWTFQDLVHCGIKVNGSSIFKTKNSTRLKTSRGRVNFQETFNLREIKPLRFCICFIFVTMFVDNVSNQEQFVKAFKNKFYLVPFTKEPNITFLYMILSTEHKVNA